MKWKYNSQKGFDLVLEISKAMGPPKKHLYIKKPC
jgi:hypothetical protein